VLTGIISLRDNCLMFLYTVLYSLSEFLSWMAVEVLQGSIYRWIQFIQEGKEKKTGLL